MRQHSILGGILLIIGTAIGAGILALPLVTNSIGFYPSVAVFTFIWLMSMLSAFFLLEVNMTLPEGSNLTTMARATLGRSGEVITWVVYLLLLYAILAAYLAGGGQLLQPYLPPLHGQASHVASLLIALVFAVLVSFGIRIVDLANRGLMFIKLGAFFLLLFAVLPHVHPHLLHAPHPVTLAHFNPVLAPIVTSFAFAMIIPSLRSYYRDAPKKLRWLIGLGSLIPLLCYILWDMAVLGTLPSDGIQGLHSMAQSGHGVRMMTDALGSNLHSFFISNMAHTFTTVCMSTSLLALALSCSDFLSDGLKWPMQGKRKLGVMLLTFIPPLVVVLLFQHAFIYALDYAGIWCCFLFIFLPIAMAYTNRYTHKRSGPFFMPLPKGMLVVLATLSMLLLIVLMVLQVHATA